MDRIGRYEILGELGEGGFGRVFLANDPSVKCRVAIKVMSNSADRAMAARFRDEATAARKLCHESIVTIYDVGEEPGAMILGRHVQGPYIVMEYLEGMDLQKILDQHIPLSLVEKVRILYHVAAGLQVAHKAGIIHRDVKPSNIMVLDRIHGGLEVVKGGAVKILDFGMARFKREGATLTRTGYLAGTLQYIPPEQFEGQAVDPMTDLWAFGATAFQLFSGKNPFAAEEAAQVMKNITSLPVPELCRVNPEVPEDLCQVVGTLLQRDRSKRYQTFEDLRVQLNQVLESLEVKEADRLLEEAERMDDLQGARRSVFQVLERYPHNVRAKQIWNRINAELLKLDLDRKFDEFLKKGDRDFSVRSYQEALNSYVQACLLNPASQTALIKRDRAQQMADRERRIREEIRQARIRLTGGDCKEAVRILYSVLADDTENAEAADLLAQAQEKWRRQKEQERADAIRSARQLVRQQKFAQAREVLAACARETGEHPELQNAEEEVRRAEAAAIAQRQIDDVIAKALEHCSKGAYEAAFSVLYPLAIASDNPDIKALQQSIEAALTRQRNEQAAAREKAEGTEITDPEDDSSALNDSLIYFEPPPRVDPPPNGKNDSAKSGESQKTEGKAFATGVESPRRAVWVRAGTVGALLLTVLGFWVFFHYVVLPKDSLERSARTPALLIPTPEPFVYRHGGPSSNQILKVDRQDLRAVVNGPGLWLKAGASPGQLLLTLNDAEAISLAPGEYQSTVQVTSNRETSPLYVTLRVEANAPTLDSLIPPNVSFEYNVGDPSSQQRFRVDRPNLQAAVKGPGRWLIPRASNGSLVLNLDTAELARKQPGDYQETVEVTSNQEVARVAVSLKLKVPKLVSLLPPTASFVYRKGERTDAQSWRVARVDLKVVAVSPPGGWLVALASPRRLELSLNDIAAASLEPGNYIGTVQLSSNEEIALVQVSLIVEPRVLPAPDPCKTGADIPAASGDYNARMHGTAYWDGTLAVGACLVLGDSGKVLQGGAPLTSSPRFPNNKAVRITITNLASGLDLLTPSGSQRVVIKNSTANPVHHISFTWDVVGQ